MRRHEVSTSRRIEADRQVLFDLIADPTTHPVIDGSGTVVSSRAGLPDRLELGSRFGMDMRQWFSYPIMNTVVEFEEGHLIAWRHFHGHRWRFVFEDDGDATTVTEAFDWSRARCRLLLELAGYPRRNLHGMRETLVRLEELVTAGGRQPRG